RRARRAPTPRTRPRQGRRDRGGPLDPVAEGREVRDGARFLDLTQSLRSRERTKQTQSVLPRLQNQLPLRHDAWPWTSTDRWPNATLSSGGTRRLLQRLVRCDYSRLPGFTPRRAC